MRLLMLTFGILAAAALTGGPAAAQNYSWCAHYDKDGGSMVCAFTSFEQCLDDVRGIGGFCEQNNTYVPPTGPHRAPAQR